MRQRARFWLAVLTTTTDRDLTPFFKSSLKWLLTLKCGVFSVQLKRSHFPEQKGKKSITLLHSNLCTLLLPQISSHELIQFLLQEHSLKFNLNTEIIYALKSALHPRTSYNKLEVVLFKTRSQCLFTLAIQQDALLNVPISVTMASHQTQQYTIIWKEGDGIRGQKSLDEQHITADGMKRPLTQK